MAQKFAALDLVPEPERDFVNYLENSVHPSDNFIAIRRLGALAFRSADPSEAQVLNTRASVHVDRLFNKLKVNAKTLPTMTAINARIYYNLNLVMTDLYVEKIISPQHVIQKAFRSLLTGMKIPAQRARPYLAQEYPTDPRRRDTFDYLSDTYMLPGFLSLFMRGVLTKSDQADEVYLPAFIDTPLVPSKELKVTIHPWDISRYKKVSNKPARLDKRILLRANSHDIHDLKLDPHTAVVYVDDIFDPAATASQNNALIVDMILDMERGEVDIPAMAKRARAVHRATDTRTMGGLIANRALPQMKKPVE